MSKTIVVNKYKETYDIYIGRSARKKDISKHFGNPFMVNNLSQSTAINMFRQWLKGESYHDIDPERRKWILENLHTLKGKRLGCFCKPFACHGDVLVELIEEGRTEWVKMWEASSRLPAL